MFYYFTLHLTNTLISSKGGTINFEFTNPAFHVKMIRLLGFDNDQKDFITVVDTDDHATTLTGVVGAGVGQTTVIEPKNLFDISEMTFELAGISAIASLEIDFCEGNYAGGY